MEGTMAVEQWLEKEKLLISWDHPVSKFCIRSMENGQTLDHNSAKQKNMSGWTSHQSPEVTNKKKTRKITSV